VKDRPTDDEKANGHKGEDQMAVEEARTDDAGDKAADE
jgi:hypothetical protein